jgi:hypothetical protein
MSHVPHHFRSLLLAFAKKGRFMKKKKKPAENAGLKR